MAVLNNYPGWLADMIQENKLGIVVPPKDANAFAEGLISLLTMIHTEQNAGRRLGHLQKLISQENH